MNQNAISDNEKRILQEKHRVEKAEARNRVKEQKARTRRLRAGLQKIVTATRIPTLKTAKTMELIFSNLVIYRCNQKQAEKLFGNVMSGLAM